VPDVRLLAEVTEALGLDLRILMLLRSAKEIILSTMRRGFNKHIAESATL
jgi:hypothetical protein